MSEIFITGVGAVSPAGWGAPAMGEALRAGRPLPTQPILSPVGIKPLLARQVPAPSPRPACLAHPRLRRSSVISHYTVAAAMEALGPWPQPGSPAIRLGIVMGVHTACVRYSARFFAEVRQDPTTASPMLFPETVINAPASHLATCLGGAPLTYSLVGDQTVFVEALTVAAGWLEDSVVDVALVVSAEESSFLVAEALHRTARGLVAGEGAGALCLARSPGPGMAVALERITSSRTYAGQATRHAAVSAVRRELPAGLPEELLCDSRTGVARTDRPEEEAWRDWPGQRMSPKAILGEGLAAATAWQFVAAWEWLRTGRGTAATLSVVGSNAAAVGARMVTR